MIYQTHDNHDDYDTNLSTEDEEIEDAAFGEFIREAIRIEKSRERTLIMLPDAMLRLTNVMTALKTLLSGEEYTIEIERNEIWPKDITIIIVTDSLGVAPINYGIFKDIINNVNSFTASSLTTGKTRFYFSLHGIYTEV